MAGYRIPGPKCNERQKGCINDGTLSRSVTPNPRPVGVGQSLHASAGVGIDPLASAPINRQELLRKIDELAKQRDQSDAEFAKLEDELRADLKYIHDVKFKADMVATLATLGVSLGSLAKDAMKATKLTGAALEAANADLAKSAGNMVWGMKPWDVGAIPESVLIGMDEASFSTVRADDSWGMVVVRNAWGAVDKAFSILNPSFWSDCIERIRYGQTSEEMVQQALDQIVSQRQANQIAWNALIARNQQLLAALK